MFAVCRSMTDNLHSNAKARQKAGCVAHGIHLKGLTFHGICARAHQALEMKCPAEVYTSSCRPYQGIGEPHYPFHDKTVHLMISRSNWANDSREREKPTTKLHSARML
jgi:hypothetical protein